MWDIAPRWGSDLLITGPNVHAIELGSRGWFVKMSKQRCCKQQVMKSVGSTNEYLYT
jgi:hypothetical protein